MLFSGERFIPGECDVALEQEHMNRYHFASCFVTGKRVLDIACGTGYGSAMMAKKAVQVIGVDISEEAIEYCKENYKKSNLDFLVGSVSELPLPDSSIDIVVSFETLEHVDEADQISFLSEIRRVLVPGGLLVISTPNKTVYDERGENEFHKHELSFDEFNSFLQRSFPNIKLCGQSTEVCNLILSSNSGSGAIKGRIPIDKAEYIVALASDSALPEVSDNVLVREDGYLQSFTCWARKNDDRIQELSLWGKKQDETIAARDKTLHELSTEINRAKEISLQKRAEADTLRAGIKQAKETILQKEAEVDTLKAEIKQAKETILQKEAEVDTLKAEIKQVKETILQKQAEVDTLNAIVNQQNESIATKEAQNTVLQNHISELEKRDWLLTQVENSKAWKLARKLQIISGCLLPPGSRRRMVMHYVYKALRHPIIMIKDMRSDKISCFYRKLIHGETSYPEQTAQFKPQPIVHTDVAVMKEKRAKEYEHLVLPEWPNPRVSIVIPAFNQFDYTYECIKSILRNTLDVSFEVVLADDCSTDLTAQISEIIDNIHVVRTSNNVRFLLNCNNAAQHARGEYIFFLNNDTQVQEDWLGSLVRLMDVDESIGMAGSKLVYPDGRLQEAGGILWRDGSAWNYGNKQDPNMPEYNYVKEVDYISGAAIMIRTSLWKQLGGFDERFVPAYCEDSDLAFMVRNAGYRVVYQPKSVVVHFEGVSNGTDTSTGLKAYQVKNSRKFFEKWKGVLAAHNPNGINPFLARDRSLHKKTILFIDHYVPEFDKDAGSRTIYQYLKMFVQKGYNVKFIGDNFYHSEPYTSILEQMGVEVLCGVWYMQHWKEWLYNVGNSIDYVWLNRPHISVKYIDIVRQATNAKVVYYGMDLIYLRESRRYETTGELEAKKSAEYWKPREYDIMRKVDDSYFLSKVEIDEVHRVDPTIPTRHISINIFDNLEKSDYRAEKREGLIFVGGFNHDPNVDAVLFTYREILPILVKSFPDIQIHIVGSRPPQSILDLNGKNMIIHGYVSDEELLALYRKSRIAFIPLRYGAGVKGKVIEAMCNSIPVVTTPIGAEGIEGAEEILQCGKNAQQLAEKIISLYNRYEQLNSLSKQSFDYVENNFSVEAAIRRLGDDFEF